MDHLPTCRIGEVTVVRKFTLVAWPKGSTRRGVAQMYTRRSLFVLLLIVTMSVAMYESSAQVLQVRHVEGLVGKGALRIVPVKPNVLVGVDAELWIIRSDDAGRTWRRVDTSFKPRVNDICFVDEDRGYAVCDSGKFLRTDDGGLTWTSSTASPGSPYKGYSFYPISRDTLLALFRNRLGTTELLRTDDAGQSWNVVTDFEFPDVHGAYDVVRCFDSQKWIVNYDRPGGRYPLITSDAGKTWKLGSKFLRGSQDILVVNDSVAFAARSTYTLNGEVAFEKTTNAGQTWTLVNLVPYNVYGRPVLSTMLVMNRKEQGFAVTNYARNKSDEDFQQVNGPRYACEIRSTLDNWVTWKEWPVERPPMFGIASICVDELGVVAAIGAENMVYRSNIVDDTLRMITTRLADKYYDALMITENTWVLSGVVYVDRHSSFNIPRMTQNVLVRTTDAGQSWTSRVLNSEVLFSKWDNDETQLIAEGNWIYRPKLEYADSETQFVTAGRVLYRTTNAGETWDSIYTHAIKLQSVSFGDNTTGYALDTLKRLYRSTDGGLSFSRIPNLSSSIAAYCAVDSRMVFASDTGVNGKLRKSVDGGENWTVIEMDSGGEITGMDVYDDDHLVISRFAFHLAPWKGDRYYVYSTTNGGLAWSPLDSVYQEGQPPKMVAVGGQCRFRYLSESSILLLSDYTAYSDYDRTSCDGGITWQSAGLGYGLYKSLSNVVSGSCLLNSVDPIRSAGLRVISGCGVAVGVEEIPEKPEVSIASREQASCEILSREELRSQLEALEATPQIVDMQGRLIAHLNELATPQTIFIRSGTHSRLVLVLH